MGDQMRHFRRRVAADITQCVSVRADVHRATRYPARWPADPGAWLDPPELLDAWVAQSAGAPVGHVMLCRAPYRAAPLRWPDLLGVPVETVCVVRQLFVSPHSQGKGLGATLLDTATAAAQGRALVPALDVLDSNQAAIALYESRGWIRLASADFAFGDGTTEPIHYYRPAVN